MDMSKKDIWQITAPCGCVLNIGLHTYFVSCKCGRSYKVVLPNEQNNQVKDKQLI